MYNTDVESIRSINAAKILHVLRHARRLLSRSEIADRVALSKVTVSNIIADLTKQGGLIRKAGVGLPDRRGGRKPLLLELDPNRKRVMGAVVGKNIIELTVSDITGRELNNLRAKTEGIDRLELLINMVGELLSAIHTPREEILGLIVALSGSGGGLEMREEQEMIQHTLIRDLDIDVQVMDVFRARAFGEVCHERGGSSDFFYLDLGEQLAGISVRRGILRQDSVDVGSCYMWPQPYEGKREDLVTIGAALSFTKLLERASNLYGRPVTDSDLSMLASQGDKIALELFREYGYNLGCVLSLTVHMTSLHRMIIGGFLGTTALFFETTMRQALGLHLAPAYQGTTNIKMIAPEKASGLRGALAMALNNWIFHTELLGNWQEIDSLHSNDKMRIMEQRA